MFLLLLQVDLESCRSQSHLDERRFIFLAVVCTECTRNNPVLLRLVLLFCCTEAFLTASGDHMRKYHET